MAFKLKRNRRKKKKKLSKKELLLKKLALAKNKLAGKPKSKIKTNKLNNNKQNNPAVAIFKGDEDLSSLNMGHLQSASGSYRKGRINNGITKVITKPETQSDDKTVNINITIN
tara:strand:+ start:288 stop:626 length:339 start_codon:yes stop_codon:yes gene_type:complete